MKKKPGFTFIEVLIAASITGIIAAALGAAMASGLDTWRHITQGFPADEVALEVEYMAKSLRQTVFSNQMPFIGNAHALYFTAAHNGNLTHISYEFDAARAGVFRVRSFNAVLRGNDAHETTQRVMRCTDAVFSYHITSADGVGAWRESVPERSAPDALRFNCTGMNTTLSYSMPVYGRYQNTISKNVPEHFSG